MAKRDKLILIDGSGYIFRAFYAIRQPLSTKSGMATNAVFGFVNMLMKVLEKEKPKHLAIAFDLAKPTFRKLRYPEYKSNRTRAPDDLLAQIPYIHRAVDAFGIARLDREGFEADDLIGTVAKRAVGEGYDVEIITGDKDLMQLVDDHVWLWDTMKDKRIDEAGVVERFGVKPTQIVDLLALMGDSSDNIPGVSGIGEKTAAELIREHGSLDGLYAALDKIKQPKRRETLTAEKETAYLSRELATVKCDVEMPPHWADLEYRGPRLPELQALFTELEFAAFLKRFEFSPGAAVEENFKKGRYETVKSPERLAAVLGELKRCPIVAVDTETTSLVAHDAKCVGVSLCGVAGEAYYIPVGHREAGENGARLVDQMPEKEAKRLLAELLANTAVKKVGQNVKYDLQVLRGWGIDMKGIAADTLLASYLVDSTGPHNLDALALRHLGHKNISYEEVAGKGASQISFAEVPLDRATEYSGEDADVTLRLYEKLAPEIPARKLDTLYRDVELPLLEVLAEMEYTGILVDGERLKKMGVELAEDMGKEEKTIHELAGGPFNIASPKQLSVVLFDKLKLPIVKKTKTGISTDERVLLQLSDKHAICRHILKYRELAKLRSTYVEGLLEEINPTTGRVHTSYNQTVAATGRLSSSNPNLQNIPVGGDPRFDIRSVFRAGPGNLLFSADYSQVELRVLADMSGDVELTRAFSRDEDVHEFTARLIFGMEHVTADQRRVAKTINFGVIYGQTPFGLSQTLKISPGEAKTFIDRYFERYPGVQKFMQQLIADARENGFVTTLLGRRRYFPEIKADNRMVREMAERAAINAPIQGTAADMIKKAMVSIQNRLQQEKRATRMLLQVHDELVFEVPVAEKDVIAALVREEMETALPLKVPLKVDVGWGANWAECG